MKPMKIIRYNGSYRYQQQMRKRKIHMVLALVAALAVVSAAVFAVLKFFVLTDKQPDEELTCILKNGETADMTLSGGEVCMLTFPPNVDIRDVTFISSDSSVVRVDSAGRADAVSEGQATVTAVADGFEALCDFEIAAAAPASVPKERTTAYKANLDVLYANKANGDFNLYSITVNRRTNTVTVYTYDSAGEYTVPVRAMVASCGMGGSDVTITGDFSIYFKEDWHPLYGDVYGMYVSGFEGPYLFHSVPYRTRSHSDLEAEEFNKLGHNASQGCVRLMASDVRWIYRNCPLNTPVHVIDADASADPLGTPPVVKIPEDAKWDPTDPNGNNPYKGKTPAIKRADDIELAAGSDFDPLSGVTATDTCDNDITDRMVLTGEVITDKPGVYYLTYSVVDDFRLTATVNRTVTVK